MFLIQIIFSSILKYYKFVMLNGSVLCGIMVLLPVKYSLLGFNGV